MVIEAGVVAGYVIAWVVRKARRVGNRLDAQADAVIDASLSRLDEVVEAKLSGHPVLAELVEEAEQAQAGTGEISERTREQLELAVAAAAQEDASFGQAVTDLLAQLRNAEQTAGRSVIVAPSSTVFTGAAHSHAEPGGIAIGQAGVVNVDRGHADPPKPGRTGH
jgi:hypothetical protein